MENMSSEHKYVMKCWTQQQIDTDNWSGPKQTFLFMCFKPKLNFLNQLISVTHQDLFIIFLCMIGSSVKELKMSRRTKERMYWNIACWVQSNSLEDPYKSNVKLFFSELSILHLWIMIMKDDEATVSTVDLHPAVYNNSLSAILSCWTVVLLHLDRFYDF